MLDADHCRPDAASARRDGRQGRSPPVRPDRRRRPGVDHVARLRDPARHRREHRVGWPQPCRPAHPVRRAGPDRSQLCDVGSQQLDRRAPRVAARVLESGVGVVDGDDSRCGPVVGQRYRQGARPGAQVDDDGLRWKLLRGSPFQHGLGLGTGYEDPGADVQRDRPERRGPQEMLQRHALRARGHDVAVALEKVFAGRLEQGKAPAVSPRQVRGQLFGIPTRRIDSRFGKGGRGIVDRAPQTEPACPSSLHFASSRRRHACCSRVCLSAAARASNRASRSPSRT